MPFYYKNIKCDTLAELRALRDRDFKYTEKAAPPGYNFHPDYRCTEYVLEQTGPGVGYERCNLRKGHSGDCEA